jgi:hypothetical protein
VKHAEQRGIWVPTEVTIGRAECEACRATWNLGTNSVFVRFEVFTAVTMKNAVFWDIKSQFVLHRRHITSPLQSPAS